MIQAITKNPALDRFIDESDLRERLSIMAPLNAEMALADSTFEPVMRLLKQDAPLAEFVRHAACSAYFGGRDQHCTMEEAFSRMGVAEFYRTVSTAVLHTRLGTNMGPDYISHADEVARLCEFTAGHCAPELAGDAYFTGLCHDAAVPAMSELLTDYQYFAEPALGHDAGVLELETECNQFTHCEAGAGIVEVMGFAGSVAAAVRYHHEPQRLLDLAGDAARLLSMVVLAERVIAVNLEQSASIFLVPTEDEVRQCCGQALGLDESQLDAWTSKLLEHCRFRHQHQHG
jgi:HD-like signal output (HDOD) protein